MSSQPAIYPRPASDFGIGSIACIVPQVQTDVDEHLESLQEKISHLTLELNMLRRRDDHVSGLMDRLDQEQRLAARLQRDFLPKKFPTLGQVGFEALYRPAGYVSGDMYDAMRLDESHVGFYVADAVGHGMPAALLSMFMKNALVTKDIIPGGYRLLTPAETMSRLNNSLCEQNLSNATFATAVYGTIDTNTLVMSIARGGHPCPLLIRDGKTHTMEGEGPLLGIFPGESFASCTVQLEPGDRVFVYTDGVEVAFSQDQTADDERWRDELHKLSERPLDQVLTAFGEQLEKSSGSLLPRDDLTILAFEVKK